MKMIALCFNTPGMSDGRWIDSDYGKKYPGAGWMRHLPWKSGIPSIWSGQTVLNEIEHGRANPSDIVVVQEENNEIGQSLIRLGADPRVMICLESPIFASKFYDDIPSYFRHSLLFNNGTDHVYFPSFDDEDIKDTAPWNERKSVCMVTANKHYSMLPGTDSPSFARAIKTQLHDYRYKAINHFLFKEGFDLYGKGWGLTDTCEKRIAPECHDKLSTIRNYKFVLCFENGSYPGYITEKIIDCLVAGVIPVYRGAPDITEYVPESLWVDAELFSSFEAMGAHLRDPKWDEWGPPMVKLGQEWLKSDQGQKFNNRVFSKRILELCQ